MQTRRRDQEQREREPPRSMKTIARIAAGTRHEDPRQQVRASACRGDRPAPDVRRSGAPRTRRRRDAGLSDAPLRARRRSRSRRRRARGRRPLRVGAVACLAASAAPEPPLAGGELLQALLERLPREVGPQLVAEHELRVRRLPEQVIGMRCSPLVRMIRSGSCISGAYRWARNSASSPPVKVRAASTISARPP